jgi:hypothetical protein
MNFLWTELIQNTVFLPPAVVEQFAAEYGDAALMPVTFRGSPSEWGAPHNNGYPVLHENQWYSLWGMRPSRDACSLTLGFKRRDLENCSRRAVTCANGQTVERDWRVHHVFECGTSSTSVVDKAAYFTNLANLVLVSREFHEGQSVFIHGRGAGAEWLKWVIGVLYPKASRRLGPPATRRDGSPDIANVSVSSEKAGVLAELKRSREETPAGSDIATRRWKDAIRGNLPASVKTPPLRHTKKPNSPAKTVGPAPGRLSPRQVTQELITRGFLARQNSQSVSLYLNLGGKDSPLNRSDFRGIVLFYPNENFILGVTPAEVADFRELVMQRVGPHEWTRRKGVPGPPSQATRVAVEIVRKGSEQGMVLPTR